MARLKSRPLHHTMKRKSQDKDRVHRENSRTSSSKRPRLQSPSERQQTVTKKAKKKRGKDFDSLVGRSLNRFVNCWLSCWNCGMFDRSKEDKQRTKVLGLLGSLKCNWPESRNLRLFWFGVLGSYGLRVTLPWSAIF